MPVLYIMFIHTAVSKCVGLFLCITTNNNLTYRASFIHKRSSMCSLKRADDLNNSQNTKIHLNTQYVLMYVYTTKKSQQSAINRLSNSSSKNVKPLLVAAAAGFISL